MRFLALLLLGDVNNFLIPLVQMLLIMNNNKNKATKPKTNKWKNKTKTLGDKNIWENTSKMGFVIALFEHLCYRLLPFSNIRSDSGQNRNFTLKRVSMTAQFKSFLRPDFGIKQRFDKVLMNSPIYPFRILSVWKAYNI